MTKKKRPVFLVVFILVQVIFLIWLIVGVNTASSGSADDCRGLTGDLLRSCEEGNDVGTAIGAGLIIALWAFVDVIFGITYGVYRLARRRPA
ncbi:hypothetical protein C6N75_10090 [Streptomyces solincola]|uniref:Uncharacterized protein n=1 Tax=Streptomyces solincola TaxID=2100817 RepID=A0A2S9PYC1_9ACTN|nr:hypothetical protein [Streptomyces solincola]PRH79421.1 hypothetical protein C6N75_10090 [Streptomyces solincola]